jgi:glycosyltransferase 2 family protein
LVDAVVKGLWVKGRGKAGSLARVVSTIVVILASGYFILQLTRNFAEIPRVDWGMPAVAAVLLSVLGVLFTIFLIALMWRQLLADQNVALPLWLSVELIAISQMGKYLPGNVGHYLGRAALASEVGVPLTPIIGSTLIEIIWTVAIGSGLALLGVVIYLDARHPLVSYDVVDWHLALAGLTLAVAPWIVIAFFNRGFPRFSRRINRGELIAIPRLSTALFVGVLMCLCFLMLGISLALQAWGVFGVSQPDVVAFTLLFAAAWLAGYVIPGAPGGLGVREGMIVFLFSPVVGPGVAVGLGVTTRLLTMLGDGVAFLLGLVGRAIRRRSAARGQNAE